MRKWMLWCRVVLVWLVSVGASSTIAAEAPDLILVNGKVVTVDDRFSIAQALAVKGGRIVAVGTTAAIRKLSGPETKVIDAHGRTVIPGLIDNHAHFRVAEKWHSEMRLDGITSRAQAIKMLQARISAAKPGESSRRDQGSQAGADDGRWPSRLRTKKELAAEDAEDAEEERVQQT